MRRRRLATAPFSLLAVLASVATADVPPAYPDLPRPAAARFAEGLERFSTPESPATGLGPVFNATHCAECHARPVVGGSGPRLVTRFGRPEPRGFDPLSELGGPVVQEHGVTGDGCAVAGERVPAAATVVARRRTPPLFGLGLVDTVLDRHISRRADPDDADGDGISGRANFVRGRVGRFGWKAQVVSLRQFTASAYLNEIGMTSPDFPVDLAPQGGAVVCDGARDPEDDGTRVAAVTQFLLLLAPLPRTPPLTAVRAGRRLFRRIGCEACHASRLRAGRTHPARRVRGRRIPMFSDPLLHDMGDELADGVPQGFATEREFRTTPLWGVGASGPYLHDGRAATLEEAIVRHGGEAAAARTRFLALPPAGRAAILAFLGAL
jgi:CxxC motif-containing protein (DUF1111 family)